MADVQSNIHVNIDTSEALASIKSLQRQISAFHSSMAKSGAAAAAVSANMQQNLINSLNATGKFSASMQNVRTTTESFTNALEKNKLSMRDYYRYSMGATKTFGKFFRSEFDTVNKVARERVKDLQTQYIKLGRDANGAMKAIAVRPLALDMQNLGTQTAMAAQRQALLNQLLKQGATNMLNFGKNTQWAGRQLMVGFTIPLAYLGTAAAKTFMKLEEQAIRFKRVYGEMFTTGEETDKMLSQIQLLAKEFTKYGVSVEKTMEMAASAAASGKMGAELLAQVNEATRLAVLGGVEQEQALETTISLTNAFGLSAEQLASKINFLNSVENQTVVSIEDLTVAIPKAGPVVKQLGGDVEDLAFFLTAMKEGGINASEGANALKSGLASLINPTEKASKMLAGMGINIQGIVEGNKGNVKQVVIDFAAALNTLDPLNRAQAIEQLFGKFQFSRLSTLFQNVIQQGNQASRVLTLTQATTEELAILSERELSRVEESTTYKFKKTIEDLKVTLAPVGEQFLKAVTPIVEFVSKILDKFNNLGDGTKKFVVILTTLLGGVGPILLMTFGLLANGLANIIKLFVSMKSVFNRAGQSSTTLGQQTEFLTSEQAKAAAIAASLEQIHVKLRQTFTSEAAALNALTSAYQRAIAAQRGFGGPIVGKGRKGFAEGTKKVNPFYFASGTDSVPAMLTPGEAVIPAGPAQDPRNKPAISHMIAGGVMSQFATGTMGAGDFSHIGNPRTVGALDLVNKLKALPAGIISARAMQAIEAVAMKFANTLKINLYGKLGITTGMSNVDGRQVSMNNLMKPGGRGVGKGEFMQDWDQRGLSRWKIALKNGGIKMQDVAADLSILDTHMKDYLTSLDANTRITDTHVKEAYEYSRRKMGSENRLIRAFDQLATTAGEARINISQAAQRMAGLPTAAGGGSKGAVDVGGMKIRRGGDRFTFYKKTGFSLVDFAEKSMVEGMIERAQVASPSKVTKKIGADIAVGAVVGMKEYVDDARVAGQQIGGAAAQGIVSQAQQAAASRAALYGAGPIDPAQKSLRRQLEKQARLKALAEKRLVTQSQVTGIVAAGAINKNEPKTPPKEPRRMSMGGVGMGLSAAAMAGSMVPGKVGEVSQKLMMPLMMLTMIGPMLTSATGALVVGLGAMVAGIIKLRMEFDKAQDSAIKLRDSLIASRDSMRNLAKFSGKVTAGEIMDRRREQKFGLIGAKPGKTTFGESYVKSKEGKAVMDATTESLKTRGVKATSADITNQLMSSVLAGALSTDQAKSIALNIGQKTGNYGLGFAVTAQINELIGPNGENLEKEPLEIRVRLIEQTDTANKKLFGNMQQKSSAYNLGMGAMDPRLAVAGGALTGAAAGAIIGSSIAPVIGTAIGAVVGSAAGYFANKKGNEKTAKLSGAVVASQKGQMEQQQEMLDSLDIYYEKKIKELEVEGKLTEAKKMQAKYDAERNVLVAKNSQLSKDIMASYGATKGNVRSAMDTGIDKMLTQRYKGTDEIQYLDAAKALLGDSGLTAEQQYLIKVKMSTGELTPSQQVFLFSNFGEDKATVQKYMDIITKFSATTGDNATRVMNMFTKPDGTPNTKMQADFLAKVSAQPDDAAASKYIDFFAEVANTNGEFDMNAYLTYYLNNPDIAEKTKGIIDNIEKNKGKLNLDVMTNFLPENVMGSIDTDYFNKLSQDERLTYLKEIATIVNIPDPEIQKSKDFINWQTEGAMYQGKSYAGKSIGEQIAAYRQFQPWKTTEAAVAVAKTTAATPPSGGGKKVDSSPLDELVKKLRDVRKNQIKVTEGWSASMKTLDQLFGGKKRLEMFSGIEQDLAKLGAKGNFIELIVGMDPKQYEAQKKKLFEFDNKGNIIALKRDAKSIQEALNAVVAGDYSSQMTKLKQELQDQSTAYKILRDAGLSYADTQELIADKAFAAMIAAEGNTEAAKKLIKLLKQVKTQAANAKLGTDLKGDIDAQETADKVRSNLAKAAKTNNWSWLEADAILSDDTLKEAMSRWDKLTKEEADLFQKRLQQVLNSIEFKESVFQKGYDKAMEKFSVMETKIELEFQFTTLKDQDIIEKSQDKIAGLNYQIDDWEASLKGIEEQEQKINDKYDAKFKALDEIRSINERISKQQKGQLTLADALSQGDIAAAARAAQDIRAQEATDAIDAQQKSLEAAKENELAQVRNEKGYTRAQIEDQIKKLRDQIFQIEEKELEPAQERVRIEEAKKRELIQSLTVLGKSKLEWEAIKNRIDIARTSSAEYMQAIQAALDVVEDIIKYWLSLDGKIITTTHKIVTIYENGGGVGPGPGPGPGPGGNDGTGNPLPEWVDPGSFRKKDEDTSGDLQTQPLDTTGDGKNGKGNKPTNELTDYTGRPVNSFTPLLNKAKEDYDKIVASSLKPGATPSDFGHNLAAADAKLVAAINLVDEKNKYNNMVANSLKPGASPSDFGSALASQDRKVVNAANKVTGSTTTKKPAQSMIGGTTSSVVANFLAERRARGGMITKRYAIGGTVIGSDTVPAMLTPGEFIMSRYAVNAYGVDKMKAINNGDMSDASVYNYSIAVNVKSDANPDEIARAVMGQIRQVDSKRLRSRAI